MITLFIGEDSASARNEFISRKTSFVDKKYQIIDVDTTNILEIKKWLYDSQSLFNETKVFFGSNLVDNKINREELAIFDSRDSAFDIFLFEPEIQEKVAKFLFKNAKICSYKLPATIFKLLDSLSPSTIPQLLVLLRDVSNIIDENIIFIMLAKRVRELILAQEGIYSKKLAGWQQSRMKTQSQSWEREKLISLYESFFRIDCLQKTSKSYFSLIESLDISLTFYVI